MRKSFLLFCAALLLFASAGLFGKTIAVNTAADLLALNTGSFVIEEGDTVEFAPGGVFDITGTPWKGIYENRGTIRGNGATVILDDLARVKYAGIFTDPFTGEDYESYRYYGFVFLSSGAIEDLSFRIAGSMSHLAPRDGGLKGDVPAMDEGSVVCVRNSGTITGCSVDGGNNSFGVYTANYGAITAHNSCVVSSCRVWGLTLSFPEEQGYQGFIAGTNLKDILGCCVHDCAIARARYAGGICGISAGRLQDCAAWDLYFRSDTAYSRIGGITGILNNNDLMRCCAFGLNLTGGDTGGIAGFGDSCGLYSCYAVCDSNEGNEAGGLFGYGYYATCTSCFLPSGVIPAGKIHETEFHYDNLPLGQFTDGTLLGALGDGWYKGPGGYPLPFEYDVNVPVAGVALDLHSVTLEKGSTLQLNAAVEPADATDRELVWSSYDKTVAKVSSSGKVTAVGPGSTTIRVKTRDGGFIDKCKVKVTVSVTGVTLDKTSVTLEKGKTLALTAAVAPADAVNQAVTWTSYDTAIATVDSAGKVKGIAPGTTTIRVKTKDGGYTAKCKVKVTEPVIPVTGVSLNKTSLSVAKGKSYTLKATVAPSGATNPAVTWQSYDASIATVDANGKVKGIAPGTATIRVKTRDGGFTAKCKVKVTVPVTGVALDVTSVSLKVGKTRTLTATVTPSDATNKKVTWSSDKPEVARVNSSGKITALKKGTATITATTKDGGFTAACKVTVKE